MKNLEIKARCAGHEGARAEAERLGARRAGILRQTDTYFRAPRRRLKLRVETVGEGTRAELIVYDRPDETGPRESDYELTPVGDPARLGAVLAGSLGVLVEVRKVRELWLLAGEASVCRETRIHLDTVEGLGTFIEFEIVEPGSDESAHALARSLMDAFGVGEGDLVGGSYSDLLRAV